MLLASLSVRITALPPHPPQHTRRPLQNKTTVHQLGLDLWRDVVVRNRRIHERLLDMLLGMVQARWLCPPLPCRCCQGTRLHMLCWMTLGWCGEDMLLSRCSLRPCLLPLMPSHHLPPPPLPAVAEGARWRAGG